MQVVRYPLLPVGSVHFLSDSAIVAAGMHYHYISFFVSLVVVGLQSCNNNLVFFVSY